MQTRIFDILESQGRSIAWLARQMGYSDNYLYLIKVGARPITDEFRRRAVATLQLPDSMLFFCAAELTTVSEMQPTVRSR